MNNVLFRMTLALLAGLVILLCTSNTSAQDPAASPDEMTIADIMNVAHKKVEGADSSLLKSVASGSADQDDMELLLAYYESMLKQAPPVGDAEEWKERNQLLVDATKGVIEGKEGASAALKKASNCMKCHKAHKPK